MKILYYHPNHVHSGGISNEWIYGIDLIYILMKLHPKWNFVKMETNSKLKLREMYATSDCLLRPSRHDGYSFGVIEALYYGLPVLHTYPIPGVILIEPNLKSIEIELLRLWLEVK